MQFDDKRAISAWGESHYKGGGQDKEEELKKLDPSLASFINVNTQKDLFTIQRMLKGTRWEAKLEVC